MKKGLLLFALFLMAGSSAFAQLTTRENDATTINLGARPQAGDASLVFNIPFDGQGNGDGTNAGAGLFDGNLLNSGDVLTYKYYNTNDVVYRVGIRLQATNMTTNGELADSSFFFNPGDVSEFNTKNNSRAYVLAPGIEKHFVSSNVFDVYAGGDVLLGLGRDKTITETIGDDVTDVTIRTTPTTVFGLGAFTGFNVFVAQLPVSVGLEYGLSAKWIFGGKTKVERELDVAGDTESAEWFEQDTDANGLIDDNQYSKLSRRQFFMDTNHNVRLVINIYFNSKSGS